MIEMRHLRKHQLFGPLRYWGAHQGAKVLFLRYLLVLCLVILIPYWLNLPPALIGAAEQRAWISIGYDHNFFVLNTDSAARSWETEETVAWSRWTFWPFFSVPRSTLENSILPLNMRVIAEEVPIDLNIWHKPRPYEADPPVYVWHLDERSEDMTFSMQSRPRVDPGVRFRREVTPETIPPGITDVQIDVDVAVVREVVVNGAPVPIYEGWIQVFIKGAKEQVECLSIGPPSTPGEIIWEPEVNHCGLRVSLSPPFLGKIYSISFPVRLWNHTSHVLKIKPVVEVNWNAFAPWFSQISGQRLGLPRVSFGLSGPMGERLGLTFSTRDGETPVDWEYHSFGRGYHGDIWIYWTAVVEASD